MYLVTLLALAGMASGPGPTTLLAVNPDTACPSRRVPLEGRKSPLDSVTFTIADKPVKVCYGRPSARGRTMLGGQVPYGKLWRTGANEPTIFFAPIPLHVAGIKVPPGVYSLYTEPRPGEWIVIVNRSTSQWGEESNYTSKVKAQELGRARVTRKGLKPRVETFTIRGEPGDSAGSLVLEWESTQVRIPVSVKPLAKGDAPAKYEPAAGKT
jgi:hypothetical protein